MGWSLPLGTMSRGGTAGAVRRQAVAGARSWVGSAAGATCRSSRGRFGRAKIAVEGAIETWESTADTLSSWTGCVEGRLRLITCLMVGVPPPGRGRSRTPGKRSHGQGSSDLDQLLPCRPARAPHQGRAVKGHPVPRRPQGRVREGRCRHGNGPVSDMEERKPQTLRATA